METETLTLKAKQAVCSLTDYAVKHLWLPQEDYLYKRNLLLDALNLDEPAESALPSNTPFQKILDTLTEYALETGICTQHTRLNFECRLTGILTPDPSVVQARFDNTACEKDTAAACKEFFSLMVANNYIRKVDIDKNIMWEAPTEKGNIKITINLAKPEKDPKAVLAASKEPQTAYPKCMLCVENEGFRGTLSKPARYNLRQIPVFLNNELWHIQFSPYVYFDQHLICFSDEHRPMCLGQASFMRMLDFVELFPHYFLGSNAPLPIVGGSILAHDHYQGGLKVLPEMKAKDAKFYSHELYPDLTISRVDWFNSVIRIAGDKKQNVAMFAEHLYEVWQNYDDASVNIKSHTRSTPHNTITPIARMENGKFVIDMILRNNRTDKEHPFGIFHPAENLHNIKKESIGIIEVMGLFILPGRLAAEGGSIRDILTGKTPLDFKALSSPDHPLVKHVGMIAQLANDFGCAMDEEAAGEEITRYINNACVEILKTTAVFKEDEKGLAAFDNFMSACGCAF